MNGVAAVVAVAVLLLGTPLALAVVAASVAAPAMDELHRATTCKGPLVATGEWRPPFETAYAVASGFGMRFHPIHHEWRLHAGVDLAVRPTGSSVVAVASGTVTLSGWDGRDGNTVIFDRGSGISTRYAHLARPSTQPLRGRREPPDRRTARRRVIDRRLHREPPAPRGPRRGATGRSGPVPRRTGRTTDR